MHKLNSRRTTHTIWKVVVLLFGLVSCTDKTKHIVFETMGEKGWLASDTVSMCVDTLAGDRDCILSVALRTPSSSAYPYREISMEVRQEWRSPERVRTDTVVCKMAARDGRMLGDGVSLYVYECPVDTFRLLRGSCGSIRVRHLMRATPLRGISDVGILLR